jgi:Flp pilus assembly protein TadB
MTEQKETSISKTVTALILENALAHQEIASQVESVARTLERIEKQTLKTNGHVTNLRLWRSLTLGTILILVPIVIFLINTVLTNTGIIRKFEQIHSRELIQTPNSVEVRP